MIDDFIDFDAFVAENGVLNSDTFLSWKRKTNGIIIKLSAVAASSASFIASSELDAYVTKDSSQTITGRKTFPAGSLGAAPITVGSIGIYSVGSILKITGAIETSSLNSTGSSITLNGITYTVPTSVTNDAFLTTGGGGALTWVTKASLLQQIASQGLVTLTNNKVVPVGTLFPWAGAGSIPDGYLECNGSTFTGSQYQALATVLSNTYGPIRNSSGTIISVKGAGSPPAYNATYQYTLPMMNGRVAIGAGTGIDSNSFSKAFALGGQEGEFVHTLVSSEVPAHTHTTSAQTTTTSSAGSHSHKIIASDNLSQNAANVTTSNYVSVQSNGNGDIIYALKGSSVAPTLGISSVEPDHSHSVSIPQTVSSSFGGGASHNNLSPYLVTRYIIKAVEDSVVNFNMSVGEGISTVSGASFISLTGGGIKVNADGTTINFTSGGALQVRDGSITPSKLSAGAPTWDSSGRLSVAEPTASAHATTKSYVDAAVGRVGNVNSFVTSISSSVGVGWINSIGQISVSGDSIGNRFGLNDLYANTSLNLPDGEIAADAAFLSDSIAVISTTGNMYACGSNTSNKLGTSAAQGLTVLSPAFVGPTPVGFATLISSGSDAENTLYALDSSGNLWAAGDNTYGQLASGTTIATSAENGTNSPSVPSNRLKLARSIRSSVTSVVSSGTNVSVLTGGNVYSAGFGGAGQMANSLNTNTNSSWQLAQKAGGGSISGVTELYMVGEGVTSSVLAKTSDGKLWGWGYNGDYRFGQGTPVNSNVAILIWDNSTRGNIASIKTTRSSSSRATIFITTTSKEIWVAGYNNGKCGITDSGGALVDSIQSWTKIPFSSFNGGWSASGFILENVYVGNKCGSSTPTFVIGKSTSNEFGLWASGPNSFYQLGLNSPVDQVKFTRVPLPSSVVSSIRDIHMTEQNTSLLTTGDQIYFAGKNNKLIDPGYPDGWNRYSFTKISSI